MKKTIAEKLMSRDGIDRRGFLECMTWAGTGVLWAMKGGVAFGQETHHAMGHDGLSFVQISDSHMGFNKPANENVIGTLQEAVARINALASPPEFMIHTGDISHLSKPEEFDTVDQILKTAKVGRVFFVPGEHDVLGDNGKQYLERYGKQTKGDGWFSFDQKGVHFAGLVNVMNLKAGGLGSLGNEQLEWLENDVKRLSSSTPIVVFAHVPLWVVYQDWGWGTDDSEQALGYLRRFGSVTVLNGHIHQTMQKVEGNITFHTAASTAFPQPKPGSAPSPGPMKVPAEQLRSLLGLTQVSYRKGQHALAIVDSSLGDGEAMGASMEAAGAATATAAAGSASQINIDNFSFSPGVSTVPAGTNVTWTNHDDIPHNVISTEKHFASPVLETDQSFSFRFEKPGSYPYYCSIHPKMTGKLVVS
ncbi:MAG: metallophosphoesterase [Acidobacteriia bacterium]|nr:metallophosphoesterase [Terriglobia bacterium]